jgi:hypothetical protein
MHETETTTMFRWIADAYEQSQRVRIETGERIRAVVQGREQDSEPLDVSADEILKQIAKGDTLGPVPILGRTYRRFWQEEQDLRKDMLTSLKEHPVYPWLSRVRGIGPTLACKLVARFDAEKADYASSFWSYAGLGTVPGERYKCEKCGLVRAWPVGTNVTGKHQSLSKGRCTGKLEKIAGPEDGVRCAQPRATRGEKRSYDAYAKKVCYLVGTSFLKAGGPYEEHYRKHRARLEVERPGWADGRKHLTALRITEKLFLSHLWQVWREAIGLPTPDPWVMEHGGHDASTKIGPWEMVEDDE